MNKFIARLVLFSVVMLVIIVLMHVIAVWNLQDELKVAYTIDPSTEVLFLGSSQVGCSIDEDPRYHLQKLWVSDTITPSILMRLRELERRGQLNHLKMVVVPFNINSVISQSRRGYLWAWYQELPVTWRYLDLIPYNSLEFMWYILCNQRFPFHIHVSDLQPKRDTGLASRPDVHRLLLSFKKSAQSLEAEGSSPEWERSLFASYLEMKKICEGHGIRFVVYKAPLLPDFEKNLSYKSSLKMVAYEKRFDSLGIEYVNPQIELDARYFFDSAHLIRSGAKIFTSKLFGALQHNQSE